MGGWMNGGGVGWVNGMDRWVGRCMDRQMNGWTGRD